MSIEARSDAADNYDRHDIGRVRTIAQSQLTKMGRAVGISCEEAYLFRESYWCGMRFTLGVLRAEWMIGSNVVSIYREFSLIKEVPFASDGRQRAAA